MHLSERVERETLDAILDAQEAERHRIARELHDETGSALSAVLLGLTAIDRAATLQQARQASAALRDTARATLESVARMAFELRPSTLGRGFSRVRAPGDRFGLVGMRERTASVNGALCIDSRPGGGTRLTVEVPLS